MGLLDSFRSAPIIDRKLLPPAGQSCSLRILIDTKRKKVHVLSEKDSHWDRAMEILRCREDDLPKRAQHLIGGVFIIENKNGVHHTKILLGHDSLDQIPVFHTTSTMNKALDLARTYLDKKLHIIIESENINKHVIRD